MRDGKFFENIFLAENYDIKTFCPDDRELRKFLKYVRPKIVFNRFLVEHYRILKFTQKINKFLNFFAFQFSSSKSKNALHYTQFTS
jgi:hypothetical protein